MKDTPSPPDDLFTRIANAFATKLSMGDFDELEKMLVKTPILISYRKRTIRGKYEFVDYWKWLAEQLHKENITAEYHVQLNALCGHAIISCQQKSPRGIVGEVYVFLHLENGLISTAIITPKQQQPFMVRHYDLDKAPIDYDTIMANKGSELSPEPNRMPCLNCGRLSEQMNWYKLEVDSGPFSHIGQVSVCPHCKKQAEFYPELFIRKN